MRGSLGFACSDLSPTFPVGGLPTCSYMSVENPNRAHLVPLNRSRKRCAQVAMSLSPPENAPASGSPTTRPHQKRCRLSVACNQVRLPVLRPWCSRGTLTHPLQCRKRKVRCDTTRPKCHNCAQRNEHCETSDPRDPDKGPAVRSLAAKSSHAWQPPTPNGGGGRRPSVNRARPENRPDALSSSPRETRGAAENQPPEEEGDLSWVSRAYQASAIENHGGSVSGTPPDVVINTDETTAHRVKAGSFALTRRKYPLKQFTL